MIGILVLSVINKSAALSVLQMAGLQFDKTSYQSLQILIGFFAASLTWLKLKQKEYAMSLYSEIADQILSTSYDLHGFKAYGLFNPMAYKIPDPSNTDIFDIGKLFKEFE